MVGASPLAPPELLELPELLDELLEELLLPPELLEELLLEELLEELLDELLEELPEPSPLLGLPEPPQAARPVHTTTANTIFLMFMEVSLFERFIFIECGSGPVNSRPAALAYCTSWISSKVKVCTPEPLGAANRPTFTVSGRPESVLAFTMG